MKTKTKSVKNKVQKIKITPEQKANVATGESEATTQAIVNNISSANEIPVETEVEPANIEVTDSMTTSIQTWNNSNLTEIKLREDSNVLSRFEYVPTPLFLGNGRKSNYAILTCSDNGAQVGKPFSPKTYSLLDNNGFIAIIEQIAGVLDSLGLKYRVATTGTLAGRERSFISLEIDANQTETIDGREFQAFLNCLNSIPSNQGCTVTFANNTFCVCCRNTFAKVLHNRDGAKFHAAIKHSKNMKAALNDIPVLVEAYFASNEALFEKLRYFNTFPVGLVDAENYFAAFIGRDIKGNLTDKTDLKTRSANIIDTLSNLFVKGKGNKGETALDVFQAVTEFYTHFSAGKSEDSTKQVESSEAGSGYVAKNEFYQWLVAHTQGKSNFDAVARVGNTLLTNYRSKPKKD